MSVCVVGGECYKATSERAARTKGAARVRKSHAARCAEGDAEECAVVPFVTTRLFAYPHTPKVWASD